VQIDITERKHAETLQLEKQRLEQASRDKSRFMARMSHELRTPMNAVLGFTRLLEDDPLEPPTTRQRERLARISQAGDRLLALIDDLLDLARLDTEAQAAPAQPLPLAEVLREASAAVAGEAERAGVRLQLPRHVSGQTHGDRRRLVQALAHVLLKVLQRCSPGADIVLQAALEADDHADHPPALAGAEGGAAAPCNGRLAVVCVFDPALPVVGQPSLFDPLPAGPGTVRSDASDTAFDSAFDISQDTVFDEGLDTQPGLLGETTAGLDIGLSLALRLVHGVGGRIDTRELPLESQPVAGAPRRVHVLRLPAHVHPAEDTAEKQPGQRAAARALALALSGSPVQAPVLHVLCVQDNLFNLQLVREVFALRPSVRLSTAVDGASGLAQALAEPPDLVLLDLQLPDMNGMEVLAGCARNPCWRTVS